MTEHNDSGCQAPLVACPACRSEGGHWIDGRFAPCEACGRIGRKVEHPKAAALPPFSRDARELARLPQLAAKTRVTC